MSAVIWEKRLIPLMAHRQWKLVKRFDSAGAAQVAASNLRHGKLGSFAGRWLFVAKRPDGEEGGLLFARYLGA